MILTCPACTMRYLVSEGAIGPSGRRVRCASCHHEWRAEPEIGLDEELFDDAPAFLHAEAADDDDPFFVETVEKPVDNTVERALDDDADFQSILRKEIESAPIPDGVKPEHEEYDPVLAQLGNKKKKKVAMPGAGDRWAGYAVAASFYILIFAAFLFLHPQISRAWPPSNLIYNLVGIKPVMPGEGLSLEELRAEMLADRVVLKGTIVNLRDQDLKVPAIMATLVDDNEKAVDQILIAPPIARIKAEGSVPFDAVYPKLPATATNVKYAFSYIKVEIAPSKGVEKAEDHEAGSADHEEAAPDATPAEEPAHH